MAPHFANGIPTHLLMWQRVREYAVPPSMIETATARRAAGDWAGACAAARVDVDLDLRAVRDRHGTDLATRLRADLRRLAPDLLRWHMPRIAPDGRLRPGLTISLARYGGSLHLVVRTPPPRADGGQRLSLALWAPSGKDAPARHPHPYPDRRFRLDLHRHLWDATRSGELAARCAGDEAPWARERWPPRPSCCCGPKGAGLAVPSPSGSVHGTTRCWNSSRPTTTMPRRYGRCESRWRRRRSPRCRCCRRWRPGSCRIWNCCGPGW